MLFLTLGQKQRLFSRLAAKLILKAYALGFEISLGEALRPKAWAKILAEEGRGIKKSLHCEKLAIDLNLFRDGKYLSTARDHLKLGKWWEKQHPLCRWGGRFGDGNHYSLTHSGRK